ncbi:MAG TPA: phosphoribosylanthranilate isomerase [Planctomycetota bacterium]|nr:phosphoribosylanthranilate isomerase [Planctomycetota bacterium]
MRAIAGEHVRLKICCIASSEEARVAVEHGAAALGLVSAMPSGPGVIDEDTIRAIAASVPPDVATFLLTSLVSTAELLDQLERVPTTHVQLVDAVEAGTHAAIRRAFPTRRIVQVVHVTGPESINEARSAAAHVDFLLLDSGNPRLSVKELGGTGREHDWAISKSIVESCGRPVFLAGGIRPDNVRRAIAEVHPHGIDLCSGVRTEGRLDPVKLDALVSEMRAG